MTERKNKKSAKSWWEKIDSGGVSEEEINASYQLAQIDSGGKNIELAILRLENLVERSLPNPSRWHVLVHYQLAIYYQELGKFEEAYQHYFEVKSHPPQEGMEEYREIAEESALLIESYLAN